MSHSTVTVVVPAADDNIISDVLRERVAAALAPFDENTTVDPYHDYVAPLPDGWERTVAKSEAFKSLQAGGMERSEARKAVWGERNTDPRIPWERSFAMSEGGIDPADDRAIAAWTNARDGYEDPNNQLHVDDGGLYRWSTYNPRSRWDWWEIGGRWAGELWVRDRDHVLVPPYRYTGPFADGSDRRFEPLQCDAAEKGRVDWERVGMAEVEDLTKWYAEYQADPVCGGSIMQPRLNPMPDETVDEFLRRRIEPFHTYAFLDVDGEWHESGRMGWWGMSSGDQEDWPSTYQKLLRDVDDRDALVVVDVHI